MTSAQTSKTVEHVAPTTRFRVGDRVRVVGSGQWWSGNTGEVVSQGVTFPGLGEQWFVKLDCGDIYQWLESAMRLIGGAS